MYMPCSSIVFDCLDVIEGGVCAYGKMVKACVNFLLWA